MLHLCTVFFSGFEFNEPLLMRTKLLSFTFTFTFQINESNFVRDNVCWIKGMDKGEGGDGGG